MLPAIFGTAPVLSCHNNVKMAVIRTSVFTFLISSIIADYPFRNISLSWNDRVDDLVSRLTAEEIMYQMARGGAGQYGGPAPSIKRLGIGPYQWNTECLRGDALAGNATAFPQAIGLAASFSPKLISKIAEATAEEVRGKHNDYVSHGVYSDHTGLSCFSPVINIMRHPLWGRNQESYGEDPFLSGTLAASFVNGLQGNHPRYIRANAGCKHFDVHGGPEDIPQSRMGFNSVVSERDWRLTFLPAFRKCVKAGTYSLMCSYNSINGIPACANSKLLTTILRDEWNFTGYVVSDETAIENIILWHFYYLLPSSTVAGCVNAGCNLELSGNAKLPVYLYMMDAIKEKKLKEETIREKVKPLFYTRMRLGEFDPPFMNPYTKLNLSVVQNEAHRRLTVEAAAKSFVLLKSKSEAQSIFKEIPKIPKIAFVGPMVDNRADLFGDYAPAADPKFVTTPYESLKSLAQTSSNETGCSDGNKCDHYDSSKIQTAVKDASVIIVCLGTGTDVESEGKDRRNMELPGKQLQLLQDAVKYGGKVPVILLLFTAGPVNITWAEENDNVVIIMQCFFPAQATGEALFALMSNKISPGGRLPYTWYKYADQIPSMVDYHMKERTYRYFTGEPLYPFGYGLSYTTFNYSDLIVPKTVKAGENIILQVTITNTGGVFDGDEVVQVYIHWLTTKEVMPNLQLVAFDRVFIAKKSSITVKLTIEAHSLAVWTDKGFLIEQGSIQVFVGGQQPNQKKTAPSNILSAEFKIVGSVHVV